MELPESIVVGGVAYWREDVARAAFAVSPTIERWYSVRELSEMSGIPKSRIYRAMGSGDLEYRLPSGCMNGRRVSASAWDEYMRG